jgi:hypothetical protein
MPDYYYTTVSSLTTSPTWTNWNTNTSSTSTVWDYWVPYTAISNTGHYYYTNVVWDSWQAPQNVYVPKKSSRQEEDQRKLAEERAEELLKEHLTDEQREMYERVKKFHVITEKGKRYEIDCSNKKRMHNVYELDDKGIRKIEHCIYQGNWGPLGDNYLAQKLMLETDEEAFRRIANQTRLQICG